MSKASRNPFRAVNQFQSFALLVDRLLTNARKIAFSKRRIRRHSVTVRFVAIGGILRTCIPPVCVRRCRLCRIASNNNKLSDSFHEKIITRRVADKKRKRPTVH